MTLISHIRISVILDRQYTECTPSCTSKVTRVKGYTSRRSHRSKVTQVEGHTGQRSHKSQWSQGKKRVLTPHPLPLPILAGDLPFEFASTPSSPFPWLYIVASNSMCQRKTLLCLESPYLPDNSIQFGSSVSGLHSIMFLASIFKE